MLPLKKAFVSFLAGALSMIFLGSCKEKASYEMYVPELSEQTIDTNEVETTYFRYTYKNEGRYSPADGIYITGFETNSKNIVIPATVGGQNIIGISPKRQSIQNEIAVRETNNVESIVISEGIEYISDYAFMGYEKLNHVVLPDSIRFVGRQTFEATALIHNQELYDEGFLILNQVLINYSGNEASVTIPEGIRIIAGQAFYEHTEIEEIFLPDSLITIGDSAFYGCEKLKKIIIPENTESIGSNAFVGSGLIELKLPDNIGYINPDIFANTPWYENQKSQSLYSDFIIILNTLIGYIGSSEYVVVPNDIKYIGEYVFYDHEEIREIILPNGLTSIEGNAFVRTSPYLTVCIPDSVEIFQKGAFMFSGLHYFKFPEKAKIERYSFRTTSWMNDPQMYTDELLIERDHLFKCIRETEIIKIPDGIKYIETEAFSTGKVKEIILPETLIEIDDMAFNASEIEIITIPGSVEYIGEYVFLDCNNLSQVIVKEGVYYIPSNTFVECSNLIEVSLPETLIFIENGAFRNCESLERIIIPDSVVYIGEYAFGSCNNLKEVVIPEHTFVEASAFDGTPLEGKI